MNGIWKEPKMPFIEKLLMAVTILGVLILLAICVARIKGWL